MHARNLRLAFPVGSARDLQLLTNLERPRCLFECEILQSLRRSLCSLWVVGQEKKDAVPLHSQDFSFYWSSEPILYSNGDNNLNISRLASDLWSTMPSPDYSSFAFAIPKLFAKEFHTRIEGQTFY